MRHPARQEGAGREAAAGRAKAGLFIALSAAGYGLMPILVRIAYDDGVRPFGLLATRFVSAFLVLLASGFAWGGLGRARLGPGTIGKLLLLGGVFFAGTSVTLYLAIGLIAPSSAELIYFSFPAFVLIISRLFLKEGIGARKIAGLALMLLGLALTIGGSSLLRTLGGGIGASSSLAGALLALLCAIVYALYVTFIQDKDVKAAGASVISVFVTGACALVFTLALLLSGGGFGSIGVRGIAALAGIIVLCTVLPIFLFAEGSRVLPASEVALIACLEPAVTVLADILVLGRSFDPVTAIGLSLIGAGLVAINLFKRRHG